MLSRYITIVIDSTREAESPMKVMKRNGTEVIFDITKIIAAITKANNTIEEDARMTPVQIQRIAESVELSCQKMNRSPSVEEIQTAIEKMLKRIPKEKLWVNPDCGLKPRGEAETRPSLEHMVQAAAACRNVK